MPRNYRASTERKLADLANKSGLSDSERSKSILEAAKKDPDLRRVLEAGAKHTGQSLSSPYGVVRAASSAYEARAAGEAQARKSPPVSRGEYDAALESQNTERAALGLSNRDYYHQFIKPVVADAVDGLNPGDKKDFYLRAAEHGLGADIRKAGAEVDYDQAVALSRKMLDGDLKKVIGNYVDRSSDAFKNYDSIENKVKPAINGLVDVAVKEKLFDSEAQARTVIKMDESIDGGQVPHSLYGRETIFVRDLKGPDNSHLTREGKILRSMMTVEAGLNNPETGRAALRESAAEYRGMQKNIETINTIVADEAKAAYERGWFASPDMAATAGQAALEGVNQYGGRVGVNVITRAMTSVSEASINERGMLNVNKNAQAIVAAAAHDPDAFRALIRQNLADENAKIIKAVDIAGAFVGATETLDGKRAQEAALGERLDAVREGDIFLKLQNAFSFNGMKAEQRGIRSEIGAIETGLPVLNDMFRERAREIKPYLGEVADPKELLSRAQTIVPAHLQRNA